MGGQNAIPCTACGANTCAVGGSDNAIALWCPECGTLRMLGPGGETESPREDFCGAAVELRILRRLAGAVRGKSDDVLDILDELDMARGRRRPPHDHRDGCMTRGTKGCVYLADGTKVVLCRDPKAKGRVWLERRPQAVLRAQGVR